MSIFPNQSFGDNTKQEYIKAEKCVNDREKNEL